MTQVGLQLALESENPSIRPLDRTQDIVVIGRLQHSAMLQNKAVYLLRKPGTFIKSFVPLKLLYQIQGLFK